jgi:type I restriction enzyme, R subunit
VVKNTTYALDFVNSSEDILNAFRTYYQTATLADVTDPNIVFDLRAKLDAQGHYDDHEVDRVVRAEVNPKATHADLVAAISPVADRLLKAYRAAQEDLKAARDAGREEAVSTAQGTLNAPLLFRNDMGAFLRAYSLLSQIFDYGNTAIEARSIFHRRLIPLLEFGRERTDLDVSKITLTHHRLSAQGQRTLPLAGEAEPLKPLTETGSGVLEEKEKALLAEIVARMNDLFQGDLTDSDQLIYVNNVIKGKLLESETLVRQASHNHKEQFAISPDLKKALDDAVIDALEANGVMSRQALASAEVRRGMLAILLGPGQLYEALRAKGAASDGLAKWVLEQNGFRVSSGGPGVSDASEGASRGCYTSLAGLHLFCSDNDAQNPKPLNSIHSGSTMPTH